MGLWITGDPKADRLLEDDPFALLIGMLLDQQVPMETAFAGPLKLADRMGGLDPARIADASPDEFAALCATPPAVHRFPGSMAGRIQAVARAVVDDYEGDVTRLWHGGDPDGREVLRRLKALPGFGELAEARQGLQAAEHLAAVRVAAVPEAGDVALVVVHDGACHGLDAAGHRAREPVYGRGRCA